MIRFVDGKISEQEYCLMVLPHPPALRAVLPKSLSGAKVCVTASRTVSSRGAVQVGIFW